MVCRIGCRMSHTRRGLRPAVPTSLTYGRQSVPELLGKCALSIGFFRFATSTEHSSQPRSLLDSDYFTLRHDKHIAGVTERNGVLNKSIAVENI